MTKSNQPERSRSSELTGGGGYTYEDAVGAYYLTALLRKESAPGIEGQVSRVAVQQAAQGEPMDDLVVDTSSDHGGRRISLQVKSTLTISDAKKNDDFREVIQSAKATRAKADFRVGLDRYGFVTRKSGTARLASLKRITEWARASDTAKHFFERFNSGGEANRTDKQVREQVKNLLLPANDDEEFSFFAHFVALKIEGLEATDQYYSEMCNRLSELTREGTGSGVAFASILQQQVREGQSQAKVWTRSSLLATLRPLIKLRSAPAYKFDMEILERSTALACADIRADIGGVELDRSKVIEAALKTSREYKLTNVRGLPGAGKSVVLRRLVERASKKGTVLFLKSDRLEGGSWPSYAVALGLKTTDPRELLTQIGVAGEATLFIDGIDRIPPNHRGIVSDLINAIDSDSSLANWRIVATSRDQGLEAYRQWIPVKLYQAAGIGDFEVNSLSEDEAVQLGDSLPHLKPLLFGEDAVRAIARRPFFASVLAVGDAHSAGDTPNTEIALIDSWWRSGGYNATSQDALFRQRALLDCAEKGARNLGKSVRIRDLDSKAL
jgi:hypothetical protein